MTIGITRNVRINKTVLLEKQAVVMVEVGVLVTAVICSCEGRDGSVLFFEDALNIILNQTFLGP